MYASLIFAITCIILALVNVHAFGSISMLKSRVSRNNYALKMAEQLTPDQEAALNALKTKMSDPSYNPATDPDYSRLMSSLVPTELRDISGALERLKVAFKDATTGVDAVTDLDNIAAQFSDKKDVISSPTSKWMKSGFPDEPASESKLSDLLTKLKKDFPEAMQAK